MSGRLLPDLPEEMFHVVTNAAGHYSVWSDERELPEGWRTVGVRGSREHCLAHIESVWTEMRPSAPRGAAPVS